MCHRLAARPAGGGPEGARRLTGRGLQAPRASTDRAIVGLFGGNLLEIGQFLYRNDNFFMLLAGNPHAPRVSRPTGGNPPGQPGTVPGGRRPLIDIIAFGDDLGMQNGPQMSPAMYREFFQPRHAQMWRRAKELADVKVMLHCCGGVRPLLGDLIEAGLDAINPVQITCRGMETAGLKRDFGDKLTFWGGGCDTRFVLSQSTPEEVRRHVLQQPDILSPGGGFVFQQVHNVLADVPPENVIAMFDAVAEFNGLRS